MRVNVHLLFLSSTLLLPFPFLLSQISQNSPHPQISQTKAQEKFTACRPLRRCESYCKDALLSPSSLSLSAPLSLFLRSDAHDRDRLGVDFSAKKKWENGRDRFLNTQNVLEILSQGNEAFGDRGGASRQSEEVGKKAFAGVTQLLIRDARDVHPFPIYFTKLETVFFLHWNHNTHYYWIPKFASRVHTLIVSGDPGSPALANGLLNETELGKLRIIGSQSHKLKWERRTKSEKLANAIKANKFSLWDDEALEKEAASYCERLD